MSNLELGLSTFALVTARLRRGARCVDHVNGSGFSDRPGRDGSSSAIPPLRSGAAPCCLPAKPLFSPCSAGLKLDLKYLIYRGIFALISWFFALDFKFLPESREVREVREAGRAQACPSRLRRERDGLRDRGGLHLAQVAGDMMPRKDLAHLGLLLGAALEGVGAASVKAAA